MNTLTLLQNIVQDNALLDDWKDRIRNRIAEVDVDKMTEEDLLEYEEWIQEEEVGFISLVKGDINECICRGVKVTRLAQSPIDRDGGVYTVFYAAQEGESPRLYRVDWVYFSYDPPEMYSVAYAKPRLVVKTEYECDTRTTE